MHSLKIAWSAVLLAAVQHLVCAQNSSVCTVTSSYDLQAGLANAAMCQILELQENITLTADSFSASNLNLVDQHITITSDPACEYGAVLNFGAYTPTSTIGVTSNSSVTLRRLLVQNYLGPVVQNGNATTFLPLFSFDATSTLYINNVQFLIDVHKCQQSQSFSAALAQSRTAWLQSLGRGGFKGGNMIDGVYYVQHAVAPISSVRVNISLFEPAINSATMTLDNCTFVCPSESTENSEQYKVVARVWNPLELLASINLQDSRLILFQQNLTTANGSWGQSPVLIANSRQVLIVGEADASSTDDIAAVLDAATPQSAFTWIINDNTDLLQLGYGGTLTLQSLTLQLPEPCCIMITLVGSWFFSNQPLPWNIFGTVLPGAFSVQAVRVPQLNPPAYLTLNNVSITYDTCSTEFAAAAQLLVSKATADTEDTGNSLTFNGNNTLYCQSCVFQGSEQVPSVYSGAVSVVSMYNTQITCLGSRDASASARNDTGSGQSSASLHPPSLPSSAASWAPPVWLPVLLAAVCCAFVALGLFAVWRHLQKGSRSFTSLQEGENATTPTGTPKLLSAAERAYSAVLLAKTALGRDIPG